MSPPQYVASLLAAYVALPDTACRPRPADRALAHQLEADGVPLQVVLDAFLLAHARRTLKPQAPPQPVRSLHYFLPVIRELANVDPEILDMFRDSLLRRLKLTQTPPTKSPTS
jgi:hypothetical protein